jgi:hypothetical protein
MVYSELMFIIRIIQRWGISYVTTLRRVHLAQLIVSPISLSIATCVCTMTSSHQTTIRLNS